MEVKWLGTATVLLINGDDKILIDPYLAKYDKNAFDFYHFNYTDISAIFITHPHLDHFADISFFVRKTNCPIYVNRKGIETARKNGLNMSRFREVKQYETVNIGSLKITAYPGRHIHFDAKQKFDTVRRVFQNKMLKQAISIAIQHLAYSIAKDDVLDFYIKSENENVFVMGSAETHPSVYYPKDIEMLILPYQGRSDMCKHATMIVKKLKPKKIFLDHFDDAFPPISKNVNLTDFLASMKRRKIPVIIPTKYKM